MDVHDKNTRSYNMSRIRSKDTKPEMLVRKFLHARGYRYVLHSSKLIGKPDLALPKYKTVIFINGCFWHGHEGCKYYIQPETRKDWWKVKIIRTKEKDKSVSEQLTAEGWKVVTVWECELKENMIERMERLLNEIE